MNEDNLLQVIISNINKLTQPAIVGISGAYTSGKTYLTNQLAQRLRDRGMKVQVIHYDDFHNPLSSVTWNDKPGDEVEAFYNRAFNTEKLLKEVLLPIKQQCSLQATVMGLDWSTEAYNNPISLDIDSKTIVLVEGVLLFKDELNQYFDYEVFLDVCDTEILKRGKQRDVPKFGLDILQKYRERYIPVYHRYLEIDAPITSANMVIDNNNIEDPIILKK